MPSRPTRQEQLPASSEVTEVAPDILRMQLPIQLPGLGHVNCYALCDDRGLAVVDPGLPGKASYQALVARLDQAGYSVEDIHTVIVTHSHHDHFGGAGVLRERAGADVLTHAAFRSWMDPDAEADAGPDDLPVHGDPDPDDIDGDAGDDLVDAELIDGQKDLPPWRRETPWGGGIYQPPLRDRLRFRAMRFVGRRWFKAPEPSRRVHHDDVVTFAGREWVAVHTPGHTQDHLCLYSPADGIVLAGDHVLPTITPHISGLLAGRDPLSQFFTSLDLVGGLDGVQLALPAHGLEFTDVAARCQAIKDHHDERLTTLSEASAALGEADVVALSHELFKPRAWGRMAESETYAHLEHLRLAGAMTARRVGEDLLYSMAPEAQSATHRRAEPV